jgi:hypothetical protein
VNIGGSGDPEGFELSLIAAESMRLGHRPFGKHTR